MADQEEKTEEKTEEQPRKFKKMTVEWADGLGAVGLPGPDGKTKQFKPKDGKASVPSWAVGILCERYGCKLVPPTK